MRHRVLTASLGRWVDPAVAWRALCSTAPAAFWLDSGPSATAGMSYLGVASSVTTQFDGPVLDWLGAQQSEVDTSAAPAGFALGWVGWLGYEVRGETMGEPIQHPARTPDAVWLFVGRCLAFDHATREVVLLALDDIEDYVAEVEEALAVVRRVEPVETSTLDTPNPATATWAYSEPDYLAMIEACQAAIREGDAYQLCLTTEVRVDARPDPYATYLALRGQSPTHHGALLVADGIALLSASPEQFLSVSPDGIVETRPIKGTRPRGTGQIDDERLRAELEGSEKERAENLMIVDLMRNDLGRICRVGSVTVTSLLAVESYAQVHQLVSTVRGELADAVTGVDAIRACFPAGSMTGVPKLSATRILDRLEARPRGLYSGVFGYVGLDGAIDLAMVIRSIVIDEHGSTIGTGGGITALSIPSEELDEARLKAAALLRVLGAS